MHAGSSKVNILMYPWRQSCFSQCSVFFCVLHRESLRKTNSGNSPLVFSHTQCAVWREIIYSCMLSCIPFIMINLTEIHDGTWKWFLIILESIFYSLLSPNYDIKRWLRKSGKHQMHTNFCSWKLLKLNPKERKGVHYCILYVDTRIILSHIPLFIYTFM